MNGNLDANTAATLALLTDTARAGNRGFGYGGGEGGGGCYGPYATPSAIQHGIAHNAQLVENSGDRTRGAMALGLDRIASDFTNAERARQFTTINDHIFQSELRNTSALNEKFNALQREINENARRAAECCCDVKLRACQDKSEILAKIETLDKAGITRELDRAERELTALKTQVACGCTCSSS